MTTFTIDTDNTITAYDAREEDRLSRANVEFAFAREEELASVSSGWPTHRFTEVWNAFAGPPPFGDLKPVKGFQSRKMAVARIWKAIQALKPIPAQHAAPTAPKKAKAAKKATTEEATPQARGGSKTAIVLAMLRRPGGATLETIMAGTGWQAHSVRGFISGVITKKMGLTVESTRAAAGERTYRIAK